jgi:hypothetical protein
VVTISVTRTRLVAKIINVSVIDEIGRWQLMWVME